jgi:hypothetical protein
MTILANSGLSMHQVAKCFGVHTNTIAKYHKTTKEEHLLAARFLGGLGGVGAR